MLTNYLNIAWRNLLHYKMLSLIKIAGLSIGLTACMLIVLYVKDEISYDRFHRQATSIYRINQTMKMGQELPSQMGITNPILGETFKQQVPEIEGFIRLNDGMATVKRGADVFTEYPLFADSNFFSVFSFPLLSGNPREVLKNINLVVLSEDFAKKYFGTTNAIGRVLQMKLNDREEAFTVSGVAQNAPQNSTIKFGIVLPFDYYKQHIGRMVNSWAGGSATTFLLLSPGAD
ncbi:MAG: ABC transporter permease, partial [Flavisolibacter sp.]|nr:ABC transporter permease [Flavisolibacter sp.]